MGNDDDPTTPDDFTLLARWRAGDGDAGGELSRRHYDDVLRFFEARLTYAAQDLTQRTFLACAESVERRDVQASFRAYLFGIARKQMLMYLRQRDRLARRQFFAADSTSGTKKTSLTRLFARREEHHLLLRSLVMLPPELQIVVQLYYWDELPTAEIATVVEAPQSTVTSRLARARELLREQITQMPAPSGTAATPSPEDIELWTRDVARPDPA